MRKVPEQTGPGFTSTSPALWRSSRRCRAGWAAPVLEKGGCAPPIAQAGCVGLDSRICIQKLHLLAGHHMKVPDRCLSSKEVEGGRCMSGSDGKLCFSDGECGNVWKDYMERIMNEENDWNGNVEGDTVEDPVVCVC